MEFLGWLIMGASPKPADMQNTRINTLQKSVKVFLKCFLGTGSGL
jgi:hypothetical protein